MERKEEIPLECTLTVEDPTKERKEARRLLLSLDEGETRKCSLGEITSFRKDRALPYA